MHLKILGNKFATYETQTMGLAEIAVPNKEKRNSILDKYEKRQAAAKSPGDRDKVFEAMQKEISDNDLDNGTDSATSMVVSGGMGGKKTQLMKLRSILGEMSNLNGTKTGAYNEENNYLYLALLPHPPKKHTP